MQEQTPYTADFNLTGEFNIHAILDVLRTKWHWFVLSTVFCLGIAYIYVKTVPVVYKREAIVQLKNKARTEEAFNEKQMFNDNNNIDGEILIFKSRLLMRQVVERLGLDVGYSVDKGLKKILYADSPVTVHFPDSTFIYPATISIIPLKDGRFRIQGLEDDPEGVMEYTFGEPLDSPIGRMVVRKTSFFTDDWLNTPVQVVCAEKESLVSLFLGTGGRAIGKGCQPDHTDLPGYGLTEGRRYIECPDTGLCGRVDER